MNNSQTSTLLKRTFTHTILNSIEVNIEVTENTYQLPLEELFTMAARINKKRSFLFVSRVLGKHLPIHPGRGLLTGALLAAKYLETTKEIECEQKKQFLSLFSQIEPDFQLLPFIPKRCNPVIIGFAETATALGHAFFDCFENGQFFHTTREEMDGLEPSITFEEEHSHATSHRCYIPIEMIDNNREIILVDDEMTTGKTALNIIHSIHAKFPRKEYTVVSILDWRSESHKQQFSHLEKQLGIKINIVSLLGGNVNVYERGKLREQKNLDSNKVCTKSSIEFLSLSNFFKASAFSSFTMSGTPFIKETGRFGVESDENQFLHKQISEAACYLKEKRIGNKTLCLGTGEFMYIPMKIASELGRNVFYQSTTRSPVHIENLPGYGARYGIHFLNPEEPSVSHNVYNIPPGDYDELFVFFEREPDKNNLQNMIEQLEWTEIKSVKIVFCSAK
nr:phosphoribosyltransferase family protein [Neobacillus sp. Marseille-Q6967]